MSYTVDVARAVVARTARSLEPGGFFFLGHAETLRAVSHEFHLRPTHETFYYQRREAHEPERRITLPLRTEWYSAFRRPVPRLPERNDCCSSAIRRAPDRTPN